jgi:DNA-binding CsgD family transcriptional regulator
MLLGRDRELRELDRALDAAREGTSSVLALSGEPGIGKSCLLDDLAGRAGGMRVLRARGIESEAHVPFAGLLELLRPTLGSLRRIPRPQAAALEAALALRPGALKDRFAVGAATLSLLAAYAEESPLLVLVDDVHWLDGSSAEALLFAVRRLVADPIAVVLAVREDEPSLLDGAGLPLLQLKGLNREQAGVLLGAISSEAAEHLFRATAGNPLALLELAHEAESVAASPLEQPLPISTSIARSFLRRSATLSEHARQGLVLAAASNTGDLTVLARAGLRVDDLAEAEHAGLIRLAGGKLEFRHPLARSAVYGEASPEQRRAAHRALADALPDLDADRRAWHLASAASGPDEPASVALEQAAQRARERTAYSVSATAFERAARLNADDGRRGRLLYQAAESAWLAGHAGRARELLDEAALHAADPQVVSLRGEIAARRGPVWEGYELLIAAAADARPEDAVLMLAEAADAAFYSGAPDKMLAAAEQASALAEAGADGKALFYAAVALGTSRIMTGGDGAADLLRAVELYETGDFGADPRALAWAALTGVFLRDAEAGRRLIDRSIATAREHTAIGVLPRLLNRLARDESMSDRWPEAEADFHEAIRLGRETGQRSELAAALAGLAWFDGRRGRENDCREHAAESRALCVELGIGFYELWTYTALGELELGLGRPDAAAIHFEAQETRAAELGIDDVDMSPAPELVDCYLRLGRVKHAHAAAAAHEARARAKGQPWALARAARCRGLLAEIFEPEFEEALALHQQTLDAFETARTRLAYGARLRRARKRVRAREQLRAALETFEALGPSPWADASGVELAATGETARRRDPSTLGELTPQELQIALLLGDGKTTREAAASLFLSPKTIEYHLRSIYRKLAINSRDALARVVRRETLQAGLERSRRRQTGHPQASTPPQ